ncbi:hypothetical protein MK137Hg34_000050300 [Viscerimonas tarda]
MKRTFVILIILLSVTCVFSQNHNRQPRENVPLDSIRLSDPFVLADKNSQTYYMTGMGGMLWKSKDLQRWTGPFRVVQHNPNS